MTEREWFKEVPYREDEDEYDPVLFILEQMNEPALWAHADAMRWLVHEASRTHRLVLGDWLRRNEAEGSEWRPHRQLEKNYNPDQPAHDYDYGEHAGAGLEDWDRWWRENWGRGRGNPGRFHHRRDMAKPPLVAVFHLVNKWWRRVLREPFHPDFSEAGTHDPRTGESPSNDAGRLPRLNRAARLFVLVAQEMDPRYSVDLCKRVHDDYYRHLDTRIE